MNTLKQKNYKGMQWKQKRVKNFREKEMKWKKKRKDWKKEESVIPSTKY